MKCGQIYVFKPNPMHAKIDVEFKVNDLIKESYHKWKLMILKTFFPNDFHTIVFIPISTTSSSYKIIRHLPSSGSMRVNQNTT